MKILFVNPPNKPQTNKSILIEPIDLLSLAANVRSWSHDVQAIDMDISPSPWTVLTDALGNFKPQVLIVLIDYHIPLHTNKAIDHVHKIANIAKDSGISLVVVGGKVATYMPQLLLNNSSNIDIALSNEAEPALKTLLKKYNDSNFDKEATNDISGISYWKKGKIHKNSTTSSFNIKLSAPPDRSMLNLSEYVDVRTILSSRGCVMNCSFCHVPGFWGRYRTRTSKQVVSEIESLVKNYDAKKILFLDDNATADKDRMLSISKGLIKKKIQVKLGCLGSISVFDENVMKSMYEAGFRWIHFGIESGNDTVLRNINKNTSVSRIKEVVSQTKKIGFKIRTSWIVDLPQAKATDISDTTKLIEELATDEIRIHYHALRMGSKDYSNAKINTLPTHYIHNGKQNPESIFSQQKLENIVESLLDRLKDQGYGVIRNTSTYSDTEFLRSYQKYVSLCPMKYGMRW